MQVFSPGGEEQHVFRGRETWLVLLPRVSIVLLIIFALWWYVGKSDLWDWWGAAVALSMGATLILTPRFAMWRKESYVLSNRRVYNLHYFGLFKRKMYDAPLERVLNVGYRTTGFFSVLLGFGDVEIQVVGLSEPIMFRNVSRPKKVYELVWKLHKQAMKESGTAFPPQYLQDRIGYHT